MNHIIWPLEVTIINNRYYKTYNILIIKALSRPVTDMYYEKHHIIPRSLGGIDTMQNVVLLTAKEHYIAHRCLTKFTTNQYLYKMLYALDAMGMQSKNTENRFRMPSRIYEYNKKLISQIGHSEETKKKIGLANKGRKPYNTGKHRLKETKHKISLGHIGMKGPPASNKTRETARQYHSNSRWIVNNKNKRMRVPKEQLNYYLQLGWHKGKGKTNITKKTTYAHTNNHKARMKSIMSQKIWLNYSLIQKRIRVNKDLLEAYISQGWCLGRIFG